jgi:hypothetical protein
MITFALPGPTLGVPVTEGFKLTFFRVAFILLAGGIILKLVIEKSLHSIAECFFICSCSGRNGKEH